jgi:hypothetical protein
MAQNLFYVSISRKTKKGIELLAELFPEVGKSPCNIYVTHDGKAD